MLNFLAETTTDVKDPSTPFLVEIVYTDTEKKT